MPEYQVRLFVRTTHASSPYAEMSWHLEMEAASLEAAESQFFDKHLKDDRYRFQNRKTLVVLERAHVLRIEIEESRAV